MAQNHDSQTQFCVSEGQPQIRQVRPTGKEGRHMWSWRPLNFASVRSMLGERACCT